MRIGYACKCAAVPGTELRTCTAARADAGMLTELIDHNLKALEKMLTFNEKNGIEMFRVSSDIIPFGSSPVNQLAWQELFVDQLTALGEQARAAGIRLSMHPGQYTVLNSPDQAVVQRAVQDLEYHCAFLDALNCPSASKIILHIGGVYGDKETATARFCKNYRQLPEAVKRRLIIENDERNYNIQEVYEIGKKLGIPVVFDNLHHALNKPADDPGERDWLLRCGETWGPADGTQKIHYSQQDEGKRRGAHSETIRLAVFSDFIKQLPTDQIDIMLEVKDKNRSAIKCINTCTGRYQIKDLEAEWARYKYDILAHSQQAYQQLRQLLKDKQGYPAAEFYRIIEAALEQPGDLGNQLNALDHVWGYFKDVAAERDKTLYRKRIADFRAGKIEEAAVRRFLYKLALRHRQEYLLNSYYFGTH